MNKTIVAIPVFGTQVSPRCDCAPEMLFVEFENGEVVSRRTTAMEGMIPHQRMKAISSSGATLLVCGAMPGFYRRMVDSLGIQIIHAEGMAIDILIERIIKGEFSSTESCGSRGVRKHLRARCPRAGSRTVDSLTASENLKQEE
jgi:predicted Fe-Mo cluster-binding NifX family protein